jgi:hypothetical protein
MIKVIKVLSETPLPFGCVLREQEEESPSFTVMSMSEDGEGIAAEIQDAIDAAPPTHVMITGLNAQGHYIGNEGRTRYLCEELGIAPELAHPRAKVCSVGFCDKEQKWYGWSHRAISGFGIGSVIRRGDCAYRAPTAEAYGQQILDFFCDDETIYLNRTHRPTVDADGVRGVMIEATYSDTVPNERLRGTKFQRFCRYPEAFGKGEWVVETLEQARQAACDFADAVG